MARKEPWYPTRESDLPPWHTTYAAALATHGVTLEIDPADQLAADNNRDMIELLVDAALEYKNNLSEVVAYKNEVFYGPAGPLPATPTVPGAIVPVIGALAGVEARTRALVQQIKAHDNYTEAIGQDLGVIGAEPPPPAEIKPEGDVTAMPNFQAVIAFLKGQYDGVDIESQVGSETTWMHIAFDGFSPYTDTRPPQTPNTPEERRYRLRYRLNDAPVGLYSDTLTVTVGV